HGIMQARQNNCCLMGIDVAINNTRAERLYLHLGFEFVKRKTFCGKQKSNSKQETNIPDTNYLILPIDDEQEI
ncbi:MAG: hypothetical protein WCJ49_01990, partial [Deltaproteobacteria bacterium]